MEQVELKLRRDEALVLFDLLLRFSQNDKLEVVDQAERRVLWDMYCLLEKQLVEPFSPQYSAIVDETRTRVRDSE